MIDVAVRIVYTGSDTMSSPGLVSLIFPDALLRCPFPVPLAFSLDFGHAPRPAIADVSVIIQDVAAGFSVFAAMPAVAARMGVLSGLQDLARCEEADLSEPLGFMDSPMGLAFGAEWGAPQRGVFVGTVVLILLFAAALALFALAQLLAAKLRSHAALGNREVASSSTDEGAALATALTYRRFFGRFGRARRFPPRRGFCNGLYRHGWRFVGIIRRQ